MTEREGATGSLSASALGKPEEGTGGQAARGIQRALRSNRLRGHDDVVGTPAFLGGPRRDRRPPPEPEPPRPPPPPTWRRWILPAVLFAATCASTRYVGSRWFADGWAFAAALMTILTCHELGHFLQARRYRVPASPPYFLPMPLTPIGTMGAVIAMRARIADSRALFDVAITGPLAGLVPTVAFGVLGLQLSNVGGFVTEPPWLVGKPLLFRALEQLLLGSALPGLRIEYHPIAVAAWTGLFITALNLLPIGQLDGGHILYTLLGRRAHLVSALLVAAAGAAVFWGGYWEWSLLLILLILMGVRHPPTADDRVTLGRGRVILGWLTLAFVLVGFTPSPFTFR